MKPTAPKLPAAILPEPEMDPFMDISDDMRMSPPILITAPPRQTEKRSAPVRRKFANGASEFPEPAIDMTMSEPRLMF